MCSKHSKLSLYSTLGQPVTMQYIKTRQRNKKHFDLTVELEIENSDTYLKLRRFFLPVVCGKLQTYFFKKNFPSLHAKILQNIRRNENKNVAVAGSGIEYER